MIRRALFTLVAALTIAACTAIVPAELPSFACTPQGENVCAAGSYCTAAASCATCQASELACDGVDEDCNGVVDDGSLCGNGTCINGRCEVTDGGEVIDSGPAPDVYRCSPQNCPAPSVCDDKRNRCVAGASIAEGGACTGDSACAGGLCAGAGVVPAAWIESERFCTRTCCSSTDCAAGLVCASAGTGGRYCVKASVLGIPSVGTESVGESCSSPAACRSGRCDGGTCTDACCTDSSCGSGRRCAVSAVTAGSSQEDGLHCQPTSGTANTSPGRTCATSSDCASGVCRKVGSSLIDPELCMAPCCSSSACGTATVLLISVYRLRCSYERPDGSSSVVASCREGANATGKRIGEACTVDGDCFSNQCDSVLGKCTDVCCSNDDCSREAAGWRCIPSSHASPNAPRCQPPV